MNIVNLAWAALMYGEEVDFKVIAEPPLTPHFPFFPTICLIDTNCDPDLADLIPANDDAIASIWLILNKLVFVICEGRSSYIRNS
ncbi:hypothetical protein Ahy_B10g102427 [Arachis hypogaea]|uniref:Uncharacterized protein n=1 Tax=Arachis hypogaea TaxID=3818 RepID=A0A444X1Q3_ARAHY|nr:hypothetical protein Ahy_B10g102427 [Arachis hypogaea]